jgi:ATP-dependent Clp protease ATP-binding subunit ClpA
METIMFDRLRHRLRDAGTLKTLCEAAEQHARRAGQDQPGAEHFVLAALDLPDGSARRAFGRLHADAGAFAAAIEAQHREALAAVGLAPHAWPEPPAAASGAPAAGLYRAQPSGQALMQALATHRERAGDIPLIGAHVLAAAAEPAQGITARTLRAMGVDAAALRAAAAREIADWKA